MPKIRKGLAQGWNVPYIYIDPQTNFIGGPNAHHEQEYIKAFESGFFAPHKKDPISLQNNPYYNQLKELIKYAENARDNFLNSSFYRDAKEKFILHGDGYFSIDLSSIELPSEKRNGVNWEALKDDINNFESFAKNKNKDEAETLRKKIVNELNKTTIPQNIEKLLTPNLLFSLFINEGYSLGNYSSSVDLWEQGISKSVKDIILNEKNTLQAPFLKLVRAIIEPLEQKKKAKQELTKEEENIYKQLLKISKSSKTSKRKANLDYKNFNIPIDDLFDKISRSFEGARRQVDGAKTELAVQLVFNSIHSNSATLTGNKLTKKITTNLSVPLPEADLNISKDYSLENNAYEKEIEEIKGLIQKGAASSRSGKVDVQLQTDMGKFGFSVKRQKLISLDKTLIKRKEGVAFHHGTYISFMRYLARFQGTEGVIATLLNPGIQHAVLNLIKAGAMNGKGEINSSSLNAALSVISYIFIGAAVDNEILLTDYGRDLIHEYNNVTAIIDGKGNGRFVANIYNDILKAFETEIEKQNDYLKNQNVNIVFKGGTFGTFTKKASHGYNPNYSYYLNQNHKAPLSQIEVEVYMSTL